MANNPLSAVSIQQFRDVFIKKYQSTEKLANTSMEIHGAIGDAYKWPLIDGADMHDRGAYGSLVDATVLDHTRVDTSFKDKTLNLPVDKGEQTLVNASERDQLAKAHADAIGRQKDKWKIDALVTATDNVIIDAGTNMPLSKILEAKKILLKNNAPDDKLYFAIHADQLESMLNQEKITSSDYAAVKALVSGDIDTYMGFKFIKFGDVIDKKTGANLGLPKTGDIRSCFAWHHDSLGAVYKLDPSVDFFWNGERLSWMSISHMIGGASALLKEGIIRIDADETVD